MSITLDTITHAVNSFNDIPDITFDSVDIGEFANEVEIYTNTPAVLIPTKLNAMASSMKTWLNTSIAAPLEAQQNTFKNEVVVRTNEAMTAVETYINNEVKAFVNDIFIPWANNSGVIMSDNANLLETNISTTLGTLMSDYSIHVQGQDAIIAQALIDFETSLAQFTTGATDSGYSVHQTNQLIAELVMTNSIALEDYEFDATGKFIISATEGLFTTHHINYNKTGMIDSFGEELQIAGEVRPFVNHNVLIEDPVTGAIGIDQVKAYSFSTIESSDGTKTFRATGHEADGSAAVDLTILNNTSIPDTDNPELTLTRGTQYVMMFDGITVGDYVSIYDVAGDVYTNGTSLQYAVDGDSILFKPFASYCRDGISEVTGHGVTASMNASFVEHEIGGGTGENPIACEQYFDSSVTILDDFSRTYGGITGETYDSALFDGMIYDVFISDDGGFVDTFAYTIDHNGKLGTGAIVNAVYDDGCSDITVDIDAVTELSITGLGYSRNTQVRIVDVDDVLTQAEATIVLGQGSVSEIAISNPGASYTGYWEVILADIGGAAAHEHTVQLTQEEVNQIKSGLPVTKTTVEAGHTHDVVLEWNTFISEFKFVADGITGFYATGDHDHGMLTGGHVVNPTIQVVITGAGAGATAYPVLSVTDQIESIVVTDGGIGYTSLPTVILVGGTPDTPANLTASTSTDVIQSINVSNPGAGYVDTSPEVIAIAIQNNNFVPNQWTAKVGDTIRFTNTDLAGHTVENNEGAFLSPNIPQNGVWDYIITKDTELTDLYNMSGSGMGSASMWVRENTVYVDVQSATGGGCRAKGSIDASGALINVAIIERGSNYSLENDTVRILDVSGPGEGAYATATVSRKVPEVFISSIGSDYSQDTRALVLDPTGYTDPVSGIKTFGYGAKISLAIHAADNCTDTNFKTEAECVTYTCVGDTLITDETICETVVCIGGVPGTDGVATDQLSCEDATYGGTWEAPGLWTINGVWNIEGTISTASISAVGSGYEDVDFLIVDPTGQGSGGVLTNSNAVKPVGSTIDHFNFSNRGTGYVNPTPLITDAGGTWGNSTTIGSGFSGTATLNNGIGDVVITEDWQDYVAGEARFTVVDTDPNPTGFGATGTIELNSGGSVSNITIINAGSAYKSPVITIDGPVMYPGSGINNVDTDIALYGPKGNHVNSPYGDGASILTNYKNGVMVQWSNENGHTLNDSWSFKLQTWVEGTPDNLVYKTYQADGNMINTSGVIALKDVWDNA